MFFFLQKVLLDFLDKSTIPLLLMVINVAGLLVPMTSFPNNLKSKTSYFIRRKPDKVTAENFRDVILFGDFSAKPVSELAVLAEEIFLPLLTNPENTKGWPTVVAQDVANHIMAFRNIVYQVSFHRFFITLYTCF